MGFFSLSIILWWLVQGVLFYCWVEPHGMDVPQLFNHLSPEGHWAYFQFFAITNKIVLVNHVEVDRSLHFSEFTFQSTTAGLYNYMSSFTNSFLEQLYNFILLPAMYE